MSEPQKISRLDRIDARAESKGGAAKFLWQLVKFSLVSLVVSAIQYGLAYLLPFLFDHFRATIPVFLQSLFVPDVIFDRTTANGMKDYTKYVVDGVVTWGYLLPFFLSNLIANIYGYIQNKKTTFKSDAPTICFVIYLILFFCLILLGTWIQGQVYGALAGMESTAIRGFSRLIASVCAGVVQGVILFPVEKFLLLKEKKPELAPVAETEAG